MAAVQCQYAERSSIRHSLYVAAVSFNCCYIETFLFVHIDINCVKHRNFWIVLFKILHCSDIVMDFYETLPNCF